MVDELQFLSVVSSLSCKFLSALMEINSRCKHERAQEFTRETETETETTERSSSTMVVSRQRNSEHTTTASKVVMVVVVMKMLTDLRPGTCGALREHHCSLRKCSLSAKPLSRGKEIAAASIAFATKEMLFEPLIQTVASVVAAVGERWPPICRHRVW